MRGKITSVKREIARAVSIGFGSPAVMERASDSSTLERLESDCPRIWRQGLRLCVVRVRNIGSQYVIQATTKN